jgi:type IV pilus assembly protein PilN
MAKINLLPWRQELRKEQQRQYFTIMGLSVVLVVLAILAIHLQFSNMIDTQENRNKYIQAKIDEVNKKIRKIDALEKERDQLRARMDAIQSLQSIRPDIVRLFVEMVEIIPDGVHLTSLTQNGQNLVMTGYAQSNARVSTLMRNISEGDDPNDDIEPTNNLMKPELVQISKEKGGSSDSEDRTFELRAIQIPMVLSEEMKKQEKALKQKGATTGAN